jgi:hypothetical protein
MDQNNARGFAFAQPQPGLEDLDQDQQTNELGSSRAAVGSETAPSGDHGSVASLIGNPVGHAQQLPVFGMANASAQFEPFTGPMTQPVPALDFNGFVLHAAPVPVPEELQRESSGASVAEPDAVLDEENGRTYHNYHEGRYYLPNDAVCIHRQWQ